MIWTGKRLGGRKRWYIRYIPAAFTVCRGWDRRPGRHWGKAGLPFGVGDHRVVDRPGVRFPRQGQRLRYFGLPGHRPHLWHHGRSGTGDRRGKGAGASGSCWTWLPTTPRISIPGSWRAGKSRENPYRDYYIWRDGKGDGPPTNWGSIFSALPGRWDPLTGQYYMHSFLPEQPGSQRENPPCGKPLCHMLFGRKRA